METNNVFSLDLNETLFFESGYEIDEMMSISIDPEISIQSFNDYVSIRGVVELEGEYIKLVHAPEEEPEKDIESSDGVQRMVARVNEKDDGKINFNHHFPIDISVPIDRVRSLEDVTVSVNTFDYTLEEPNHLKITSTLNINGVHQEKTKDEPQKTEQSETPNIQLDDTFQFKVIENKQFKNAKQSTDKSIAHDQKKPVNGEEEQKPNIELVKDDKRKESETNKKEDKVTKEIQKDDLKAEKTSDDKKNEQPISKNEKSTPHHTTEVKDQPETESKESRDQDEETPKIVEQVSHSSDNINVETHATTQDDDTSESEELQDITYLADMFESDEEIEPYQMRLCIVQKDDTIVTIAERYEIQPQQIIQLNGLDDEQLMDGQLLLIPTENQT